MARPTNEQVEKWAKEAYNYHSKGLFTGEAINKKIREALDTDSIMAIIAKVAGCSRDHWGEWRFTDDFEQRELYQLAKPLIQKCLAEVMADYKFSLKPKEIASIRAVYRRAHLDQLRKMAEQKGGDDAQQEFNTIIQKAVSD
jgi:hypothetical protein